MFKVLIISAFLVVLIQASPYRTCSERKTDGYDINIAVEHCENKDRCPLYIGSATNFSISFTSNVTVQNVTIQRVIYGILDFLVQSGKPLEVKYNTADANQTTYDSKTLAPVSETMTIEKGKRYGHHDVFKVPVIAPRDKELRVRYILQEKADVKRVKWFRHPGVMYACAEIDIKLIQRPQPKEE